MSYFVILTCIKAWLGHPYYEVIDNSTDFEMKMRRLIKAVADKLSIPHADEICQAVKLKFLLAGTMPELEQWPVKFRDFEVEHDYLPCYQSGDQARVRRRGRHGEWEDLEDWPIFCLLIDGVMLVGKYMYTHTIRNSVDQRVETRTNISLHPEKLQMPDFLTVKENVTGNPQYSMFNLSEQL